MTTFYTIGAIISFLILFPYMFVSCWAEEVLSAKADKRRIRHDEIIVPTIIVSIIGTSIWPVSFFVILPYLVLAKIAKKLYANESTKEIVNSVAQKIRDHNL